MTDNISSIRDLPDHVGQTVTVRGWVRQFRSSGGIRFVVLRDGTGDLQIVVPRDEIDPQSWEVAEQPGYEASLRVEGVVREDRRAPGGFEMTPLPMPTSR